MKIIIIGAGSIGQRHYRNLLKIGYRDVSLYDSDPRKTQVSRLVLKDFDAALICTPNHLHTKYAVLAAKAGCHLFVEKPLSHELHGLKKLITLCQNKKLTTMVGCNIRFNPGMKFLKAKLERKFLGKIYAIEHEFGYYLPYWRPTDYRKNYAAKKNQGGGIILDDIHEFDLLFWLNDFSEVRKAKFLYGRVSPLEIETEDFCLAGFQFANKSFGVVKCDYLQRSYARNCKIIGEKGTLVWDFKKNTVWLEGKNGKRKLFSGGKLDLNQMYIDEIKYFLSRVQAKKETFSSVRQAFKLLQTIKKNI